MRKIYLTLLAFFAVIALKASPDIYTPTLAAPANNAVGVFPNVTLDWNPVTGLLGLYYEVQLDTSASFTNPVTFTTELTSKAMSKLLFNQQYHWRVRAIDGSGTSDWSVSRAFTVINTVIIKRPLNDAINVAPNVEIQWTDLPGASYIEYQLDTTENFNSPLLTTTSILNNTNEVNAANLYFGYAYKIRMRALHDLDTSVWSESRTFNVINSMSLKKPANSSTGIVPDATFEWTKIDGLTKYQIHISIDPDFGQYDSYNVLKTLGKYSPDTLMFNKQYYWRMAAIHETDTLISGTSSFTTIDKPTLLTPSNNSTNVELQPTLTWEGITGLVAFQLDIADNAEFNDHFTYYVNDGGGTEFKVPIHVLDSASVYYWRVRAISSRDTSMFSDTWTFRSVTLGNEEAISLKTGIKIYPSPANNKVNIKLRDTFNGLATVEVYDLLGTRRITTNAQFNSGVYKDFTLSELPNGIYMMSIIFNGQRHTSKLIIQK
ncbi:MAG TPA: T9SS type A sorting domain-containing protein [Lentimicrobium sp.]|nr:T9SS type A sorting domain-containing protein [Lentimicrobium sp.]